MAHVYCDQALVTGSDNGTSWDDAYRLLTTALNGSNTGAGDTLWVKNDTTTGVGSVFFDFIVGDGHNPPNVYGVKAATLTTALPPVQSDLIPGLRTGDATRAYAQTGANSPPTFTLSGTANDITINGTMGIVYGLVFKAADNLAVSGNGGQGEWEECEFSVGQTTVGEFLVGEASPSVNNSYRFLHCKMGSPTSGSHLNTLNRVGMFWYDDCEIDFTDTAGLFDSGGSATSFFDGCDFTATISPIIDLGSMGRQAPPVFNNCKLNASSALTAGTELGTYRAEFIGTSSGTGKTTGQSFQDIDIITDTGTIVQETTAIRTNGANDGSTGAWSLAFTPDIDQTVESLFTYSLVGPWMAIEVTGDGTAQTLTVFIANTGAADYFDDDVWLEAFYPSETGTAQYDYISNRADLLATPVVVPDDTGSTWGTGGDNHQKLSVTISPDYDGFVRCRVCFAKRFASAPETLYVDPLPVLS